MIYIKKLKKEIVYIYICTEKIEKIEKGNRISKDLKFELFFVFV